MSGIILTQNSTFIIGPVAKLLGYLMDIIFVGLNKIGIPNVGLAIIIFTIVIYLLMMPLTIKQQKFSKLSAKMNPELQEIQKKYKNKKDNDSLTAMNQETQAVYAKYGVSPTGSCVQLIIQMPILFALYRVIYAMPAYVTQIKNAFFPLVDNIIGQAGGTDFICNTENFKNASYFTNQFTNELFLSGNTQYVQNTVIDVLNKASTAEWSSIADKFPSLSNNVAQTLSELNVYNSFLGLNIADSPSFIMREALSSQNYILIVGAIMIPVLAAFTQWISVKLMPQASTGDADNPMASSMKTMNMMMPLMSAFFCLTLPAGMGIYWIAGAVVRGIQQVAINKHIDKMDMDELVQKNSKKAEKKMAKIQERSEVLKQNASINTKSIQSRANLSSNMTQAEKDEAMKKATEYYNSGAKPGSIAAKASMVKQYNEKNNK